MHVNSSTTEAPLIAEQLRRAFEGDAWHGPAVLELLQDVRCRHGCSQAYPQRP